MFRTRAGDFRISSDVKIDDITKINVAHNDPSGTVEIEYDDGFTVDIASGSGSQRYWPGDWTDGVVFRFSTFTAYMTELEIQGMLSLRVDQLPPQLTKFSHDGGVFNVLDPLGSGQYVKFEGLTMGGKSLPTGLVDLHIENVRSPADVDRIIEALETNAQNNGSLFLAEQRLSKTAELLETRGWTVELEPQFAHKIERSKAPHTSVIDGKAVHHVDRRRGGDRRKQFEGRCIELNGTSEYATGPSSILVTTQCTISAWVKTTDVQGVIVGNYVATGTDRSIVLWVEGNKLALIQSSDGTYSSGTASDIRTVANINDGEWHHVCGVFNAGTLALYVDGTAAAITTVFSGGGTTINQSGSASWSVGGRSDGNALLAGKIYNPQIFDTALPAAQIQALAEAGPQSLKPTLSSVPLIWLPMDDATSSPIIRNYGSLGSAGDFVITGTPSAVWSTQDRFSYPNAFGASAALVTNGVDSYVDTGVTLNAATAFTVLRRFRTLSNDGYDLDGFHNTGGNSIRLGRNGADDDLSFNYGSGSNFQEPNVDIEVGQYLTQAMVATANGTYSVRHDGVEVASATATGFTAAISNTHNYTIGVANENGTPGNWGHIEFSDYLIASRVLTDDEITWWRTRGASGTSFDPATDPDIHVDYRFDQPHPRIVHNYADPGNPGKIVGDCEWVAINHDAANPTLDMNGKALTWKGQVPRDAVISSPAVELNGTSEYFQSINPVDLGGSQLTASAKFKTTDADGGYIFSLWDYPNNHRVFQLGMNVNGNVTALVSHDGTLSNYEQLTSADPYDDGEWHTAELTFNAGTLKLFIDKVEQFDAAVTSVGTTTAVFSVSKAVTAGAIWNGTASRLSGEIADCKLATTAATDEEIYNDSWTPNVLHWPCCEPSGTICYDVSGNNNHGTGAPTARTGSQNLSDHLITNGFAKGTHFDGASDSYSRATLVGGATRFCASFYVLVDSLASSQIVFAESVLTGDQRSFQVYVTTTGAVYLSASSNGTAWAGNGSASGVITAGKLHHVDLTWDAGTLVIEVDGVDASASNTTATSMFASSATFEIGAHNGGSAGWFGGTISRLLIHKNPTAVWSTTTKAAIRAAKTTEEIKAIVDNLGGTAWYFPDANTNETLQGLTSGWTTNGAPEERVIPAGAGVPITYGPGIAAPGQDRLIAAEPNSPFALRYAGDYSLGAVDLVYEAVFGSGASHVDLGATLIGATDDFDISLDFLITSFSADAKAALFGQYTTAVAGRMLLQANSDLSITAFVDHTTDVLIVTSTDIIQLNRWHSVRFVRVGDDFELFVDGVSAGTQTQSGISVEQSNSFLSSANVVLDELNGKIRNIRIDNAGTVTELLTRGIALPGATLTNVTVSSKEYGAIGGRILFQKPDGTANLYESSLSAEMADIIASRKYY